MGVDAHISFKVTGSIDDLLTDYSDWPSDLGPIIKSDRKPVRDNWFEPNGGEPYLPGHPYTHVVNAAVRYWDGDEKDKSGLRIITALLALMRHPNVETVWYGPDGYEAYEVTKERMMEIVAKWIRFEPST